MQAMDPKARCSPERRAVLVRSGPGKRDRPIPTGVAGWGGGLSVARRSDSGPGCSWPPPTGASRARAAPTPASGADTGPSRIGTWFYPQAVSRGVTSSVVSVVAEAPQAVSF